MRHRLYTIVILSASLFWLGCGDMKDFFSLPGEKQCGVSHLNNSISSPLSLLAAGCGSGSGGTGSTDPRFFVISDRGNHRLLLYPFPLSTGMSATVVWGQTSFTTSTTGTTQSTLNTPQHGSQNSTTQFFIADGTNNRILVFSTSSPTTGQNAANVLGQTGFTSSSTGLTQSTLNTPHAVEFDASNNRLFVSDNANVRLLVFNVSSITNGQNAANVLGQANFTSNASATTQAGLIDPGKPAYDASGQRLFLSDGTARVMVYSVSSISNGQSAANVLGQSLFTTDATATTQSGLSGVTGLCYGSGYLFVSDGDNNRIMIFDVNAITNGENAAYVLGQTGFTTATTGTTASTLSSPRDCAMDATNNRLFVNDQGNHRVLVYDVSTLSNGKAAYLVLGQTSFTSGSSGTTASTLNTPHGNGLIN